jgi:hypothetical protein
MRRSQCSVENYHLTSVRDTSRAKREFQILLETYLLHASQMSVGFYFPSLAAGSFFIHKTNTEISDVWRTPAKMGQLTWEIVREKPHNNAERSKTCISYHIISYHIISYMQHSSQPTTKKLQNCNSNMTFAQITWHACSSPDIKAIDCSIVKYYSSLSRFLFLNSQDKVNMLWVWNQPKCRAMAADRDILREIATNNYSCRQIWTIKTAMRCWICRSVPARTLPTNSLNVSNDNIQVQNNLILNAAGTSLWKTEDLYLKYEGTHIHEALREPSNV